ncbi:Uncharacterized protein Fot_33062 [Forsythia ovata]|uniref:Dolichyl-diphosphooligosaccharide--protein glycosyltransferase subunit 4A n=1 Tax=Forsythia ovata TaxID=205694 RepID=A0ABD1T9K1_9LAMI
MAGCPINLLEIELPVWQRGFLSTQLGSASRSARRLEIPKLVSLAPRSLGARWDWSHCGLPDGIDRGPLNNSPPITTMIDDQDLGFFANFLGIFIFVLVIAYHYVMADPKYEGN